MTAEQSPQVRGSRTSTAQTGQYKAAAGLSVPGGAFGALSTWLSLVINNQDEDETVTQFTASLAVKWLREEGTCASRKNQTSKILFSSLPIPRAGRNARHHTIFYPLRRIAMFLIHFQARIEVGKSALMHE
jgi:hypothetical protein